MAFIALKPGPFWALFCKTCLFGRGTGAAAQLCVRGSANTCILAFLAWAPRRSDMGATMPFSGQHGWLWLFGTAALGRFAAALPRLTPLKHPGALFLRALPRRSAHCGVPQCLRSVCVPRPSVRVYPNPCSCQGLLLWPDLVPRHIYT